MVDTPPVIGAGSDRTLRLGAGALSVVLALAAFLLRNTINPRVQALAGIVCFIAIVAAFSTNLRAVSWRTVLWGMVLQLGLALFILKLEIGGVRPGFVFFSKVADVVKKFLEFTNAGSTFVFGELANQGSMDKVFGPGKGFVFAFTALPTIIFVSSFFTVLYYFGVLQFVVKIFARAMMFAMRTSGAETLSAAANVFMGQTEAPIIVKPYVPLMTQSELLAMMVGGMATISGGVMAVYITLGADPVAILTTSVMAAPCGLYLAKILYPELEEPVTRGEVKVAVERQHINVIDAAAAGASDGTLLAINDLLGTKLVANEFVAYIKLTQEYRGVLTPRSYTLATYALTGFANFASIGIQLGGIGGMAPSRRGDLARLGGRALLVGFLATLINAAIASMLL